MTFQCVGSSTLIRHILGARWGSYPSAKGRPRQLHCLSCQPVALTLHVLLYYGVVQNCLAEVVSYIRSIGVSASPLLQYFRQDITIKANISTSSITWLFANECSLSSSTRRGELRSSLNTNKQPLIQTPELCKVSGGVPATPATFSPWLPPVSRPVQVLYFSTVQLSELGG